MLVEVEILYANRYDDMVYKEDLDKNIAALRAAMEKCPEQFVPLNNTLSILVGIQNKLRSRYA